MLLAGSLFLLGAFPVALLVLRHRTSGSYAFGFLYWNLFLAGLPVAFALVVETATRKRARRPWVLIPGLCWLLFFPNGPYLTTDIIHMYRWGGMPAWFDAVLLASVACVGIISAVVSLFLVHMSVRRISNIAGWGVVAIACGTLGLAIYLGRFIRLNSWDVAFNPTLVVETAAEVTYGASNRPADLAVLVIFSTFFTLTYLTIYALAKFFEAEISHVAPSESDRIA